MCWRQVRWIAGVGLLAGGCAGDRAREPVAVLRTEDFIADPATMPTTLPAAPTAPRVEGVPGAPAVSALAPGVQDVTLEQGPPPLQPLDPATAAETPTLVDAKIGEINGRPIRVDDVFRELGKQLATTAQTRAFTVTEWRVLGREPKQGLIERSDWVAFAEARFRNHLSLILHDEILAAEARASLKPEQRVGLSHFVKESQETKRRSVGGSKAELERKLRADNQNEQRYGKDIEAKVLVEMQVEEKVRNRYKASWKDVQRYYARHISEFQVPGKARFRLIRVPESDKEGVAAIRGALEAGKPFAEAAALPANRYDAAGGGLFDVAIVGPMAQATPFSFDELNAAAQKLTPGEFTKTPVAGKDRAGENILTWLYLDSLETGGGSLADPDVQIGIVNRLNESAREAGMRDYVDRLERRATFTDIEMMTRTLVDIAAERYWPPGQ